MSWTFGTSAIAIKMAGEAANATIVADATTLAVWSDMAEGIIEVTTGKSYLTDYASLGTGVKGVLNVVACAWVAMKIIAFDTTGYLSREADALLNVNDDIINQGMKYLKDFKNIKLKSPL